MKKALITGISGFAGSFLAEHLIAYGDYEVIGTYLSESSLKNLSSVVSKVKLHKLNLQDEKDTENLILEEKPAIVLHLAALPSAAESFNNPREFINNNIGAQINILEGIRRAKISPRILIVSSAEVYGNVRQSDLPITEGTQLAPVNPYAVSKVAQDFLGLQYFLSYKMQIVRVRPFNHIGPRQSPSFVVSSFAKKIAEIEKNKIPPLLAVGNLSAKRDFTDVRDIVRGYLMLVERGREGDVYNIGSGRSYQISDLLHMLLSLSKKEIKVAIDKNLLRPIEVPELVCDNTKIRKETSWKPEIPIEKSLSDTLDYWRSII